ncbi:hypothetical protein ACOME3_007676 [Neoechinorhynchus agilis]
MNLSELEDYEVVAKCVMQNCGSHQWAIEQAKRNRCSFELKQSGFRYERASIFIEINHVSCLRESNAFLNDAIVHFYCQYVFNELSGVQAQKYCYVYDPLFMESLKNGLDSEDGQKRLRS